MRLSYLKMKLAAVPYFPFGWLSLPLTESFSYGDDGGESPSDITKDTFFCLCSDERAKTSSSSSPDISELVACACVSRSRRCVSGRTKCANAKGQRRMKNSWKHVGKEKSFRQKEKQNKKRNKQKLLEAFIQRPCNNAISP